MQTRSTYEYKKQYYLYVCVLYCILTPPAIFFSFKNINMLLAHNMLPEIYIPETKKKKKTLGVILPRNCMWCVWMGSPNIFFYCFVSSGILFSLSLSHFLWFDHLIVVTFVYLFDTMNQSLFDYLLQWISHSQKKIESTGGQLNINTLVKIFVFFLIKFHISQSKYRSIWSTKRKIYLFH